MAFVEIARERKFTLYRDNSDPSVRRAVIGIDEKYYQDASGAWQPVNESFVDDPVYGGKSCNTVQHKFQVANGGKRRWYPRRNISGEYLEITGIQYYSNRWRTLNLPTPVWRSNFVEWDMTKSNTSAYLTGEILSSSSFCAYLSGSDSPVDLTFVYLEGASGYGISSSAAFIRGIGTEASIQSAYICSEDILTSSTSAYLAGEQFTTHLRQAGTKLVKSFRPPISPHPDYTASQVNAYLGAQNDAEDKTPIFISGSFAHRANQIAWLAGLDYSTDSIQAYSVGSLVNTSQITAYLAGGTSTQGAIFAFIYGKETIGTTENGYLAGSENAQSSKTSYLQGQDYAQNSIPGYLKSEAQLEGSQLSFTAGADTAATIQGASTWEQVQSASSQTSYLKGESSTLSSLSAYIPSGISGNDNIPAYTSGLGSEIETYQKSWTCGKLPVDYALEGNLITQSSINGSLLPGMSLEGDMYLEYNLNGSMTIKYEKNGEMKLSKSLLGSLT